MTNTSRPTRRRHPVELCERAVRMVRDTIKETGQSLEAVPSDVLQLPQRGLGRRDRNAGVVLCRACRTRSHYLH